MLNRANSRLRLFKNEADFAAFEQVLTEACARVPLRVLGYVLMGNHWHFVVWPRSELVSRAESWRWGAFTGAREAQPKNGRC